jgi:hypothetical protein
MTGIPSRASDAGPDTQPGPDPTPEELFLWAEEWLADARRAVDERARLDLRERAKDFLDRGIALEKARRLAR